MKKQKQQFMKLVAGISLFGVVTLFCFANAYGATSTSTTYYYNYDNYGTYKSKTTSSSYTQASHETTAWQELDTGNPEDSGVLWSTDGGSTWGHDDVYVGDTLSFKFNMYKQEKGTHYADHLKAWLDKDNNQSFDESDQIIYREELVTNSQAKDSFTYDPSNGYTYSFQVTENFLTDGLYLRARVTCSESLLSTYYSDNTDGLRPYHNDGYDWNDQFDWEYRNEHWTSN